MKLTGAEYRDLIAKYILSNYQDRGIEIFTEVNVGKSIIGKSRRIDLFVYHKQNNDAFAIECKYQSTQGTVDEKIPYALEDMKKTPMTGCIVYAGEGFSQGVLHLLQSSEIAAFCFPDENNLHITKDTLELDHLLAIHFKWWDVLISRKTAFEYR